MADGIKQSCAAVCPVRAVCACYLSSQNLSVYEVWAKVQHADILTKGIWSGEFCETPRFLLSGIYGFRRYTFLFIVVDTVFRGVLLIVDSAPGGCST